ncbi:hypothetical protein D3C85_1661940 [compost metagenome]
MQEVFSNTSKVLVSGKDGQNNLLYLPLDKMVDSARGSAPVTATSVPASDAGARAAADMQQQQRELRSRESR